MHHPKASFRSHIGSIGFAWVCTSPVSRAIAMARVAFGFACISLHEEPCPANSWVAKVIEHSGLNFLQCSRKSLAFGKLVNHQFEMMEAIQDARMIKCTQLMAAAADVDVGPGADKKDEQHEGPVLKKAKRSMIDEVEKVVEVTVRDESGQQHVVRVMSAPYKRSPLVIELTDANVTLLTKKPMADQVPWVPEVLEANVQWSHARMGLMCRFYDINQGKWRKHSMKVQADFNDKEAFQDAVNRLAKVVQEYYVQHHTEPDEDE
eukprot:9503810-Pyramimonas_sp.AAC.3